MPVCEFQADAHLPAINGGMFVRAGQKLPVPANAVGYLKRQSFDGKPVVKVFDAGKQVWPETVSPVPVPSQAAASVPNLAQGDGGGKDARRSRR